MLAQQDVSELFLDARAGHSGLRFATVFFDDKGGIVKKELPLLVPGASRHYSVARAE